MKNLLILSCALATGVLAALVALHADAPHIYAIRGARVVTGAGPALDNATVVIRGGLIDAVGASVSVPAVIDMGTSAGLEISAPARAAAARTTEDVERAKRESILRPQLEAANYLKPDPPELRRLAQAGVTTALATPPGDVMSGRSSLVNTAAPPDQPQIGSVADPRRGLLVVKTPVALHVAFTQRPQGNAYPNSLMGVIAFVRQSLVDAQRYQLEWTRYDRVKGVARPTYDQSLAALGPALEGKLPVAFEADLAREIRRALAMANEFKLDPIVTGAQEANQVADELKAAGARVIVDLNFPTRSRLLAPDADEPLRELQLRANVPKVAAALDQAGITFAFRSGGLSDPKDFLKNASRTLKAGLSSEAALRALTTSAAKIAGVADRLGSIEKGKIANVIVTTGDLFDEKTTIQRVFVDGRPVALEPGPEQTRRPTSNEARRDASASRMVHLFRDGS
ncbi:MAG: amidohydrolase family protein [Acidobacteria bacterium]|nr:amidohydrolase family protein [Acidobacteriota bacterium]